MSAITKIAAMVVLFSGTLFPDCAIAADSSQGISATVSNLGDSTNVLFILIGGFMILFMHGGFAFLEVGSVRTKNQVNALNKILCEYGFSCLAYLFIGYAIANGSGLLGPISDHNANSGIDYVKFFMYLGFAACIPAIISGGVAERAKFWTNSLAGFIFVAIVYPFIEALTWGGPADGSWLAAAQTWLQTNVGEFSDFAGSVIVHGVGGWIALPAIILLGPRIKSDSIKVSSIPWLALGSWMLIVGWFSFNVMSAGNIQDVSGLVAINSLLAMVGGTLAALVISKNDAGFVHNGALAGLVAICAGSNVYHPLAALFVGAVAGAIFVYMFSIETEKMKIDDVLGVWPLHGICGVWGGLAVGLFVAEVSFITQLIYTLMIVGISVLAGFIVYGLLKRFVGIRLDENEELKGSDLTIHKIQSNPEDAIG